MDLRRAKIAAVMLSAAAVSVLFLAGIEVWVRAAADHRKGTPGFFLSDPVRVERLSPNYSGWFAGVPVHVNGLGLRDTREYDLGKSPNTIRVLVLGDSVTFGHGSLYEHTYPYLLEQRLRAWQPRVDWQVWNAAVPGYNTSHELAQLLEVGPSFAPDLVIIGFFENDIAGNIIAAPPSRAAVVASRVRSWVSRHVYSVDWYRDLYLRLRWRLSRSDDYKARLEQLAAAEALLANPDQVARLPQQQLTPVERLSDEQVRRNVCDGGEKPSPALLQDMQRDPGWPNWIRAVRELQRLNRSGAYRIVFFVNMSPPVCPHGDIFYDGGSSMRNNFFLDILGADGTPAVSAYDAFLHRRPSQMPLAWAHSIGNSNATKADTLFEYLTGPIGPLQTMVMRRE
jgi:hypothetical protein